MNLTIPFIVLAIMFVAVVIGWSETWKTKEHYRCRVFDLTDGKEGSNLVKVVPTTPPPPPPEKPAAPEGMFRPLLTEWFDCGYYGCFRKSYVVSVPVLVARTSDVSRMVATVFRPKRSSR